MFGNIFNHSLLKTQRSTTMLCGTVCFYVFGILQLQAVTTDGSIMGIISKEVILPCKFQPSPIAGVVLHWMRILHSGTIVIHSFYRESDQLSNQDENYRGRTKLFKNEIMRGNASLQLSKLNNNDEGEYQCYVSTPGGKQETDVLLQVAAHWKSVTLENPNMLSHATNVTYIACSSLGGYPKPLVTWQDNNENDLTQDASLEVATDPDGLFNVQSMLKINQTSDITYKCNITNERMKQSWTAIWKMKGRLNRTEGETIVITCDDLINDDQNVIIKWRFRKTEISPLLKICESTQQYGIVHTNCSTTLSGMSNIQKLSSFELQNVTSYNEGEYTCEISTKDAMKVFTYFLRIDPGTQTEIPRSRQRIGFFAAAGIVGFIILLMIILIVAFKNRN